MKRSLSVTAALCLLSAGTALAIPPFSEEFKEQWGKPGMPLENPIAATKCNVCHIDKKPKKQRNAFGEAVARHLKKADFGAGKKWDPKTPAGKQAIQDGLEKAGQEKAPNGQKFKKILENGQLP